MCPPPFPTLRPFFPSRPASLSPRRTRPEPEPRTDPRVDRGSRDTMIYAPCVRADLLMRAPTAFVTFLPREANGLGKRRRTGKNWISRGMVAEARKTNGVGVTSVPRRRAETMETVDLEKSWERDRRGAQNLWSIPWFEDFYSGWWRFRRIGARHTFGSERARAV